jgi:hypothetical protein
MFQIPCPQSPFGMRLELCCWSCFMCVLYLYSLRWFRPDDGETHHDRSCMVFHWYTVDINIPGCLGLIWSGHHARTVYYLSSTLDTTCGFTFSSTTRASLMELLPYVFYYCVLLHYCGLQWLLLIAALTMPNAILPSGLYIQHWLDCSFIADTVSYKLVRVCGGLPRLPWMYHLHCMVCGGHPRIPRIYFTFI